MAVTIGKGYKSTLVELRIFRRHVVDGTQGTNSPTIEGPSSEQPWRAQWRDEIETVAEIDGKRISADSVSFSGYETKRNVAWNESTIEAVFSFVYKSRVFPVQKEIIFYWPKSVYINSEGQRETWDDQFSFSRQITITGEGEESFFFGS